MGNLTLKWKNRGHGIWELEINGRVVAQAYRDCRFKNWTADQTDDDLALDIDSRADTLREIKTDISERLARHKGGDPWKLIR